MFDRSSNQTQTRRALFNIMLEEKARPFPSQPLVRSKHTCPVSVVVGVDLNDNTLLKLKGLLLQMVIILKSDFS